MTQSIPLFSTCDGNAPRFRRHGQDIDCSSFLLRLHALAAELPEAPHLINLCDDRFNFTLVLGVALSRNTPCLLPPDRLEQTHRAILRAFPRALYLTDADLADAGQTPRSNDATMPSKAPPRIPSIDADVTAALAFAPLLGAPDPHPKPWGQLVSTAQALARRFDLGSDMTLVATVPPQHMYGLEMSIILPLIIGMASDAERPLFPADIRTALARQTGPTVLVTTPVHLSAIAATSGTWPPVSRVISATAPLDSSLAARIESLLDTQVHEVYGTTETGALATRRTLDGPVWSWLDGVHASQRPDGRISVRPGPFSAELTLPDRIAMSRNGLRLLGPPSDLIKVAGKRASLAALDRHLRSIPGVDAGLFLPVADPTDTFSRPTAVVVAPTLHREDILRGLRGRIDPLFLPRRIVMVDDLPLDSEGRPCRVTLMAMLKPQPRHPQTR